MQTDAKRADPRPSIIPNAATCRCPDMGQQSRWLKVRMLQKAVENARQRVQVFDGLFQI